MARQDGADLLGFAGQRLVDFHARAAGIGEDDLHAFAFEGLDEDVAAEHAADKIPPSAAGRGTDVSSGHAAEIALVAAAVNSASLFSTSRHLPRARQADAIIRTRHGREIQNDGG
jgi:preprotein translocase subunit SecA